MGEELVWGENRAKYQPWERDNLDSRPLCGYTRYLDPSNF